MSFSIPIYQFDLCELYNILIGGIIVGIIASFIFVWLTNSLKIFKFKKDFKHLRSRSNDYDWIAYSMCKENGKIRQNEPNGSRLNLKIKNNRILIILKQIDGRVLIGEIGIEGFNYCTITYKYRNEHEYGKKECIIGSYTENDGVYDYLFTIPINNQIYNIQNGKVEYNYGNELFIRKKING